MDDAPLKGAEAPLTDVPLVGGEVTSVREGAGAVHWRGLFFCLSVRQEHGRLKTGKLFMLNIIFIRHKKTSKKDTKASKQLVVLCSEHAANARAFLRALILLSVTIFFSQIFLLFLPLGNRRYLLSGVRQKRR